MFKEKSDSEMIEKIHLFLNDKVQMITQMMSNFCILLTV
jgi:hypothetical protein